MHGDEGSVLTSLLNVQDLHVNNECCIGRDDLHRNNMLLPRMHPGKCACRQERWLSHPEIVTRAITVLWWDGQYGALTQCHLCHTYQGSASCVAQEQPISTIKSRASTKVVPTFVEALDHVGRA